MGRKVDGQLSSLAKLRFHERYGCGGCFQLLGDNREVSHRGRRAHGGTTTTSSTDHARLVM